MSYFGDGPCPASCQPGSWLVEFRHAWYSMAEVRATGFGCRDLDSFKWNFWTMFTASLLEFYLSVGKLLNDPCFLFSHPVNISSFLLWSKTAFNHILGSKEYSLLYIGYSVATGQVDTCLPKLGLFPLPKKGLQQGDQCSPGPSMWA